MVYRLLVLFFVVLCAWVYQNVIPPPPTPVGPPNGLPVTAPRITLRDGRQLSYLESGVPKDSAKAKLVFIHGFHADKYFNPFAITATPALIEELGVYVVAFDRPGYLESDPDPNRTLKSLAMDIEDLADQLNLGSKFYLAGYSMGGMFLWPCLKYIRHRLAGAVLIAPAINYRWPNLPVELAHEEYKRIHLPEDVWALRVTYYLPWLTYWWNTQKWFPNYSLIDRGYHLFTPRDIKDASLLSAALEKQNYVMGLQNRQQGDFESLHRDLIVGHTKWDFGPTDIENPFPNNDGSVHLWMGDDDRFVSVYLNRYIAQQLQWIKYHEIAGAGHMMGFENAVADAILKELLDVNSN